MSDFLKDAYYTYFIAKRKHESFSEFAQFGEYIISHTPKTDVAVAESDNKRICIIGFCVDSHAEIERQDIAGYIAYFESSAPEALFKLCDRFAGKYIIMAQIGGNYYLWGDASCYLPINYTFAGDSFCACSFDKTVADFCGFQVSSTSKNIKYKGPLYQQMPYNTTMYDEVKALLANQYLDIGAGKYERVKLDVKRTSSKEHTDFVLENTFTLAQNTAKEYTKYYDFAVPLTAGYDSRLIFGMMQSIGKLRYTYTMKHKRFTETTPDYAMPIKISAENGVEHRVQEDVTAPDELKKRIYDFAGEWTSPLMIDYGYTVKSIIGNDPSLNGQIAGQIGKYGEVNGVPNFAVSPVFAQWVTQNKSNYYLKETKKHFKELKSSNEKYFGDLFAWECRTGRWAAQNEMINSLIGINMLNIFNCRELILKWISLPAKLRRKKIIHYYGYNQVNGALTRFSFNYARDLPFYKKIWPYRYFQTMKRYYFNYTDYEKR